MAETDVLDALPVHPPPDPGECLSGYLVRLAAANGEARVWNLVRELFPRWTQPFQVLLLRWEYPIDDAELVLRRTHLPRAALLRLTVVSWVAKFRVPPIVTRPGQASPAVALQGIIRPTLYVCPRCVQDRPAIRLLWRLTPVRACLDHGCLLQGRCSGCGEPLPVIAPTQRSRCCRRCGADLRTVAIEAASEAELVTQRRRQADLRFLLDPRTALVAPADLDQEPDARRLSEAIGLKFRYLRLEAGRSLAEIADEVGVRTGMIAELERGEHPSALLLYLSYLDTLGLTWPDFAAVTVPIVFFHRLQELPYRALRLCPTPTCPNHQSPPGTGVTVLVDLPARRVVRFRCTACRRTFTRHYDGTRVTKPRRPPLQPGETPPVVKSAEEIAQLTALGRRGLPNRQIARQLGWGEKTVGMYWIALNLEEQVHAAQAQREAQAAVERGAVLRARVVAIVDAFEQTDEEITLCRVSRALGHNEDYLHSMPALAAEVQEVVRPHNARVRSRRVTVLADRVTAALAKAERGTAPLTVGRIARGVGLTYHRLLVDYPALHARVQDAVRADHATREAARRQGQVAQINAAAARLSAEGIRLSYAVLHKAAGVNRYRAFHDVLIHDVLHAWIGD